MELPQKRKRTVVVKTEPDESEIESLPSDDDEEYAPSPKKARAVKKEPKEPKPPKEPKIKKEPKPKKERVKKEPKPKKEKVKKEPKPKIEKVKKEPKPKKERVKKSPTAKTPRQKKIPKKEDVKTEEISTDEQVQATDSNENNAGNSTVDNAAVERMVANAIAEANESFQPWLDEEVIAEICLVPVHIARNVTGLFDQEMTIPFIVRYRSEMTGGLQADKLREIQTAYEEVKAVHKKVETITKTVKHEKFDTTVALSLMYAKTLEEVEILYAPFKPGSKKTLSERAKQLGLEPAALRLLEEKADLPQLQLHLIADPTKKGLETEKDVLTGIQHIIADKIFKDRRVLEYIRLKSSQPQIRVSSCKTQSADKEDKQAFVEGKSTQNFKYENYFEWNVALGNIAPHHVMALNRGEKQKVLKVKIEIPTYIKNALFDCIWNMFFRGKFYEKETLEYLRSCVSSSYERHIEPYMSRQIRTSLSKNAEKESISVFGSNVKSLLLTPPVRGMTVVGIDPGFTHGCKIAAVSSKGEVLTTDVIYPHSKGKKKYPTEDGEKLLGMVMSAGAEVIAIGNGTACRETEVWLSDLMKSGFFHPHNLKYCIVNESGVSIYSVTKEAEAELPNLVPNLRSAVSIARRLQDPLLEYVKVEPKHLGVGMYQHDVSDSQLKKTLDGIVEECVSFVGVDLNVCPEILLRKISGLSTAKAKAVVEWRRQNGCFLNRLQLKEVKGLGPKSFEQCAGFVRIIPLTSQSKTEPQLKKKAAVPNPLDRTIIHPESYSVAEKFLKELQINPADIGQQSAVNKVTSYMQFKSAEYVATAFTVPVATAQLIIDALKQLQDYDIRGKFEQPLFRTSVRSFTDLSVGQELTGRVSNVTGFGCFVDVGVGQNGLIHVSKMKGTKLNTGDKVRVNVINVDVARKRLGLEVKL